MSKTELDLNERLEWALAIYFSGNRQPHMSGDPRARLSPGRQRDLSDAVLSVVETLRQAAGGTSSLFDSATILEENGEHQASIFLRALAKES